MKDNLQLNSEGKLKHFLSIEGLPKELLTEILDVAESFVSMTDQQIKKVPLLRGKTIVHLFFENSTRTMQLTGERMRLACRVWRPAEHLRPTIISPPNG